MLPTADTSQINVILERVKNVQEDITEIKIAIGKSNDDHETRLRMLEKVMVDLSRQVKTMTAILAFVGLSIGGYMIAAALRLVFP